MRRGSAPLFEAALISQEDFKVQRYCCFCFHTDSTNSAFEIQPSKGLFNQKVFSQFYSMNLSNQVSPASTPSAFLNKPILLAQSIPATITGSSQPDTLRGTNGNDSVYGLGGDDQIFLYDGDDYADGGASNDEVSGGNGNDIIDGGDGNDTLSAGAGNDTLRGGAGNDKLYSRTTDMAASFDDGGNIMEGGAGDDEVYGGNGNDTIDGGDGNDLLNGGEGNDTFHIRNQTQYILDSRGTDTAYVYTDFAKIPSYIENVVYRNGALPLPYWIDSLLPDQVNGQRPQHLVGNGKQMHYSFPSVIPLHQSENSQDRSGWTPFSSVQQRRAEEALEYISTIVNLKFAKTTSSSESNTIVFSNNDQSTSAGYARYPSGTPWGSDVYLDNSQNYNNSDILDGSYAALTLIHELGHALGLKHPFGGPDSSGNVVPGPTLGVIEDVTQWTIMSYSSRRQEDYTFKFSPLDIAALQYLYGPSTSVRSGNDSYSVSPSDSNFIWDGGGSDTISAASTNMGCTIYLTPGYWGFFGPTKSSLISSAGQITINFGTVIENLIGSGGSDYLYGSQISNRIEGGLGDDSLHGMEGDDFLGGGGGNDQINGGGGIDTAVFQGTRSGYTVTLSGASATVTSRSGSEGVDTLSSIERLRFSDSSLALDLNGAAGVVAKALGAIFGRAAVQNKEYVGIGLSLLDSGMSTQDLMAAALAATGKSSSIDLCSLLWTNLVGAAPTLAEIAPFKAMLDTGQITPAALAAAASDSDFNAANINLIGLSQRGLEYQ